MILDSSRAVRAKLDSAGRKDFIPDIGIVLGSGLGPLAQLVQDPIIVEYGDIPGFMPSGVEGHAGKLWLGYLGGKKVACLQGRAHLYEGKPPALIKTMVRTLKELGCGVYLATNAAGGINADFAPGDLMMLTDHINAMLFNPLIGPNDEAFGPRFPPMDEAYDPALREILRQTARKLGLKLHEGVYVACLGPNFETPAEIKAFGRWGADAVGMSTVPEVLVARHCGMRVAAISVITNLAAGMSPIALSHDQTLEYAEKASGAMTRLVSQFISDVIL